MANPYGRPKETYPKERFDISIEFLQSAISNPKVPYAARMNAVCLLMTLSGLSVPKTRAMKEQVKDLVVSHSFQKKMSARVDRQVAEDAAAKLRTEQEQANALELANTQAVFDAVLDEGY